MGVKDRDGGEDDTELLSLNNGMNDNMANQSKGRDTEGGGGCCPWWGELIGLIWDMLSLGHPLEDVQPTDKNTNLELWKEVRDKNPNLGVGGSK